MDPGHCALDQLYGRAPKWDLPRTGGGALSTIRLLVVALMGWHNLTLYLAQLQQPGAGKPARAFSFPGG